MPVQIASFLIPRNGNTFALLEDRYFKGGLRVCTDVVERNELHPSTLKEGMLSLTLDDNLIWQLGNDLVTWTQYKTATAYNPFYTYIQVIASTQWIIAHNRNCRLFVASIYDLDGGLAFPDSVETIDDNTILVTFLTPFAGHCALAFDQLAA